MKIKGKIIEAGGYKLIFSTEEKMDEADLHGKEAILIVKGTATDRICRCGIREDVHDEMETITHDFDPK